MDMVVGTHYLSAQKSEARGARGHGQLRLHRETRSPGKKVTGEKSNFVVCLDVCMWEMVIHKGFYFS